MLDIKKFCTDNGLTQKQFGDIIEVEQSVVSHMVRGLRKMRLEYIDKLRARYGDIVDAYRTDAPPQRVPAATMTAIGNGNTNINGNGNTVNAMADVVVAEVTPSGEVVTIEQPPVVPDKIVRDPNIGVLDWVNDPENDHSQNAFNIASILRRTKFIIQMNNNAMAPTIYQNEYVFLKPFSKKSEIIDGEIYGIETEARGVLIRFLYDEGDHYLARPKNKREFGDIRIPKVEDSGASVKKYHIVFHGSTHLSSLPDNEGEMARQLGQQSEYITALINQQSESMKEISKAGQRVDRLIDIMEKK